MGADSPEIAVGSTGDALYISMRGRATQRTCPTADKLVRDYLKTVGKGASVVVDVSGCDWVDSTFAGWLTGLRKKVGGDVVISGCGEGCRNSLARMHLDDLFRFADVPAPEPLQTLPCLTRDKPTKSELELMLAAHEQLAALSDENLRMFGPIAEMLRRQIGSADS